MYLIVKKKYIRGGSDDFGAVVLDHFDEMCCEVQGVQRDVKAPKLSTRGAGKCLAL
jgi:hypothetical protein